MTLAVVASCIGIRWVDMPVKPDPITGLWYYLVSPETVALLQGPPSE